VIEQFLIEHPTSTASIWRRPRRPFMTRADAAYAAIHSRLEAFFAAAV
jgi:hypothetical protein